MADAKKDKLQIRNSTVDFLVFTKDAHEDGIEVRVQDHDVWLTQKAIARLFDVDRSVVTKHLKNVYESGELSEDATCANFAQVADNGKTYHYKFYSLPAIIAVGLSLIHIFEVHSSFLIRRRIDHLNAHKPPHPLTADMDIVGGLYIVKPLILCKLGADTVG